MIKIMSVTQVTPLCIATPFSTGKLLYVSVLGEVATSGWSAVRLSPYFYAKAPADGIWDFDLIGDPPSGVVGEVVLPVNANFIGTAPAWCRGVRIHAEKNKIEELCKGEIGGKLHPPIKPMTSGAKATVRQDLASYDDSIQPTGTIHWKNDGPWGTPNPHIEMKKLHHTLVLTIEGPDEGKIRDCIGKAFAAGIIAAIAAAIGTGGIALEAALSAALSTLTSCLGDGFSARIDDQSHWEYWDA